MTDTIIERLTQLAVLDETLKNIENMSLKQAISTYITIQSTEIYKMLTELQ